MPGQIPTGDIHHLRRPAHERIPLGDVRNPSNERIARQHASRSDDEVQLCTLLSIKTGGCSEDCGYCAQSARYHTGVKAEKLMETDEILAVAKAGSFRAAAEAMHLSQPALSQHVAEMERELGARLFDRLGRKVALTEAGRILEEHALRLFASVTSAREAVADLSELKGGSLVIGASTTPGIYVLPGIIAAFQGKYPRVVLSLRLGNSALIEELIRRNEVDLGVVGGHPLRPGEPVQADHRRRHLDARGARQVGPGRRGPGLPQTH